MTYLNEKLLKEKKHIILMVILMPISDHLQSFTKYLRLPLVFMRNSTLWEKLMHAYIYRGLTAYIYTRGLGTRLSFYGV